MRRQPPVVGRRGRFATPLPAYAPTATSAGVAYLYENVGALTPTAEIPNQPGLAYLYENVGLGPLYNPIIGRVVALPNDSYGVGYLYENVT